MNREERRAQSRQAEEDWLSEVIGNEDDGIVEVDRKQRTYSDSYAAWMDDYELYRVMGGWEAACKTDGELFTARTRPDVRQLVETHIMRHGQPPRRTYVLPEECPF